MSPAIVVADIAILASRREWILISCLPFCYRADSGGYGSVEPGAQLTSRQFDRQPDRLPPLRLQL